MANCPIQVVLNSPEYIMEEKRNSRRGYYKDYYAGRDDEFKIHRDLFVEQLELFSAAQSRNPYSRIAYAKVKLEKKAIAKTCRPTQKLITKDNGCKVVGGSNAGEMLVRFSPFSPQLMKNAAENAELKTTIVTNKKGKNVPKPSVWRSEIGAIKEVCPISAEEKCSLSADDILSYIKENGIGYLTVELFEAKDDYELADSYEDDNEIRLFSSFIDGLKNVSGVKVYRSSLRTAKRSLVVSITNDNEAVVNLQDDILTSDASESEFSTNAEDYECLLNFLTTHPLVKQVTIMPIVQSLPCPSFQFDGTQAVQIPKPGNIESYPLIGIADTGISDTLNEWVTSRYGNVPDEYKDPTHGTFIGGLYITGKVLNPTIIKERDGNRLVEICVLPKEGSFCQVYKNPFQFFNRLRIAIERAVDETGVRVIGLSLNREKPRESNVIYTDFAQELDDIAVSNNVILVISGGNLSKRHREWIPTDVDGNIAEFTSRKDDIIYCPAESIRNISVGALNPPDDLGLTNYTCVSKGLLSATKPDLVHVGGFGNKSAQSGYGLYSISPDGNITTSCGTSFAAPMVTKTIAALAYQIDDGTPRETLIALTLHNAVVPSTFKEKKYRPYLRDWIGFGMPVDSETMLNGSEHSISLVFHNTIRKGQALSFPFSWPDCLVRDGKCYGHVKVTMVSTPQLEYSYGAELVREDVRPSLRQMDGDNKQETRLKPIYATSKTPASDIGLDEEDRKDKLYQWNPVKVYEIDLKGVYKIGRWYLEAKYADRENVKQTESGLEFTMILTIEDTKGKAPVYHEMRQALQLSGVQIADIQTNVRVQPRG